MPFSTKFQRQPYTIAGDSFISSATDLSSQHTKNMVPVPAPNSLNNTAALYSFPGLKLWSSGTAGEPDRGIHKKTFLAKGWKVSGNTLYSFDSNGTQTNEGTIGGSGLVSMADNGTNLVIVASGTAYSHDGSTLSTLSLSFAPDQVDYLNERLVMLDTSGNVHLSDVATTNFGTEIPFQAKSSSDLTRGIKVFDQFLFIGGEETFEPWQDIGSGNPPFARVNGVIIESVGLANKNCMCNTTQGLYFLGNDKLPYRIVSFQARSIAENNPGIAALFDTYTKSGAYVECSKVHGQDVIMFVFEVEKKTWCYSEETGLWFELDHDVDGQQYLGKTFAPLFSKILVGDRSNGNIYELDVDTYQDNSATKVRERVFRPMAGETLGAPRANLQMKCLQFAVNTGVGVSDDSPQMEVSISTDGGRNFGSPKWLGLGEVGDYIKNVDFYSNSKFKDLTVKIRYTENTAFDLYDSAIWIREAGR